MYHIQPPAFSYMDCNATRKLTLRNPLAEGNNDDNYALVFLDVQDRILLCNSFAALIHMRVPTHAWRQTRIHGPNLNLAVDGDELFFRLICSIELG